MYMHSCYGQLVCVARKMIIAYETAADWQEPKAMDAAFNALSWDDQCVKVGRNPAWSMPGKVLYKYVSKIILIMYCDSGCLNH